MDELIRSVIRIEKELNRVERQLHQCILQQKRYKKELYFFEQSLLDIYRMLIQVIDQDKEPLRLHSK